MIKFGDNNDGQIIKVLKSEEVETDKVTRVLKEAETESKKIADKKSLN